MKVCTIEDIAAVDRVLKHPEVYKCISDDNSPTVDKFTAESVLSSNCHVIMPNNDIVFVFIPHNGSTHDVHIISTPSSRGQHAINAGIAAKKYAFEEVVNCVKLMCFIPEIYNNVAKYVEKMGFLKEGELTKSYSKNGKLYNEYIYGLRRSEWE